MDLTYGAEYEAFREEVLAFLDANWPPTGDARVPRPKLPRLYACPSSARGGPRVPVSYNYEEGGRSRTLAGPSNEEDTP